MEGEKRLSSPQVFPGWQRMSYNFTSLDRGNQAQPGVSPGPEPRITVLEQV